MSGTVHNSPLETELLQVLEEERLLDAGVSYAIQAGYFEKEPDRFSTQSLLRGLSLKADLEAIGSPAKVFTLHNDLGQSCEEACPPTRGTVGEGEPADGAPPQAPVIREKTALNRGLRLLRKALKEGSPRLVIEATREEKRIGLRLDDGAVVALAVERNGNLVGLCPLILASFYEMLVKESGPDAILIDYCHYVEVPRVSVAVQVLQQFFLKSQQRPRAVVAAALDHRGENLNTILFESP